MERFFSFKKDKFILFLNSVGNNLFGLEQGKNYFKPLSQSIKILRSMETKLLFHFRGIFANLTCAQFLKGIEKHRTDEGLTLETSAFSLRWPIYLINSVVKSKILCLTSPSTQHHSFFRN